MEEAIQRIQHLCSDRLGLNVREISEEEWRRKLREGMRQAGAADYSSFYMKLVHSPEEFQAFVEVLIVPESWFFRDKAAIDYMVQHCLTVKSFPIRLLSLPCATGEEPYSLAMAFFNHHFTPEQFHIDAIDISRKSLEKAEKGIYEKYSFRNKALSQSEHFFSIQGGTHTIQPLVRQQVSFSWGNICDRHFLSEKQKRYEVIFCRNLLIYLNAAARQWVFRCLEKLLSNQGILFVAPAEVEIARRHGFKPLGPAHACALRP